MALKVRPFESTIAALFWSAVQGRADDIALCEKRLGVWREIRWSEYGDTARSLGYAMLAMGVGREDCIAVLSEPRPEWLCCDMAAQCIGATTVGIYTTNAPSQVEYLVNDCRPRLAFVEDDEHLDKFFEIRERTPSLERIVVFDMTGLHKLRDPMVTSYEAFIREGKAAAALDPDRWLASIESIEPDDRAIIVYTSGTTGPPKGAMLSHRNVLHLVEIFHELFPPAPGDEVLSSLPLSHIAERFASAYRPLRSPAIVNFVESKHTFTENMREVEPTYIFGVPRTWEKFYSAIKLGMQDATPIERLLYEWGEKIGYRVAEHRLNGSVVPPGLRLLFGLASVLVFSNIKKSLGLSRARVLISGAAPISPDLLKWFIALGLDIVEGYGQTESGGAMTVYTPETRKLGTVGKPVRGIDVKIGPDGEILLRGPGIFLGYLNQPEKTAETLRDGWLHSGDVGYIDNQGYLVLTDRMKDIIITAGGKNVTPSEIENELKFSPFIADAIVIGESRKYLTALIMIDYDNVAKFAQDRSVPFTNFASLTRADEVNELINGEVTRCNNKFNQVEQIKKFRMIDVLLTAEDEEMTPTLKLKRKLVSEKYAYLIDPMYSG